EPAEPVVRPALQPSDTPAFRPVVGSAKQVRSRIPTMAGAPLSSPPHTPAPMAAPAAAATTESPSPASEDDATTPGGKKFLKLALQALTRNDLNGARLNLTFALGYEPENAVLKRRL